MRCHTNVSKCLRRVSLVQRTRRQARCLLQLRYLLPTPLNVQVWPKAFFLVGLERAHTRPTWPKIPSVPLAFHLLGAPQSPGNKHNNLRRCLKVWGKALWGRRKSRAAKTHSARSMPQQVRLAKVRPNNLRSAVLLQRRYLLRGPPNGPFFFGGSGCRAVVHTRKAFSKNARGPVGIPLISGASGTGRLTQPPQRS